MEVRGRTGGASAGAIEVEDGLAPGGGGTMEADGLSVEGEDRRAEAAPRRWRRRRRGGGVGGTVEAERQSRHGGGGRRRRERRRGSGGGAVEAKGGGGVTEPSATQWGEAALREAGGRRDWMCGCL
ncbi:hypothetical protein OsI_16548 [Oryza sativa Indica Group]|uniref:Uncharacterized protein n=1 Tax=Oryza sativa subsp. indica TaxID=39946 RepID=A2XVA8_ORYSI|nr:hypothetical protein OsI_16548 [Oryza sativa Indica Group]